MQRLGEKEKCINERFDSSLEQMSSDMQEVQEMPVEEISHSIATEDARDDEFRGEKDAGQ